MARNNFSKVWAAIASILLITSVVTFGPQTAQAAEVTAGVNSTMTLTMQNAGGTTDSSGESESAGKTTKPVSESEKGGGLAITGDSLIFLLIGFAFLGAGAAYVALNSRKHATVGARHAAETKQNASQKKIYFVTILSVVLAVASFGCFAWKTNALAGVLETYFNCHSNVVVDSDGNVTEAKINVTNNTNKNVSIDNVVLPSEISDWTASFDVDSVPANSTVTGTLSGSAVSSELATELKEQGSVSKAYNTVLSFDNTEVVGSDGVVTVYDPTSQTEKTITVTDGNGNSATGSTVEINNSGKTNVAVPSASKNNDVVVNISDSGSPLQGKTVDVIDADGVSRGEGTSNSYGNANYVDLDSLEMAIADAVYDGTQQKPSISLTGLEEGVDYQVTWGANVNAGTGAGSVTVQAIGTCSGNKSETFDIAKAKITVSGIAGVNRNYDGTNNVSLDYSNAVLAGKVATDDLSVTAVGSMDDKNSGNSKEISISNIALSGASVDNYELASSGQQTTATININKLKVVVTNMKAGNKEYDRTQNAVLDTSDVSITGTLGGETVGVQGDATFEDWNAGTGKKVSFSNLNLTGDDALNYEIDEANSQSETTANITAKKVSVSQLTADDREYNRTNTASIKLNAAFISTKASVYDDLYVASADGTFQDSSAGANDAKNVGVNKTVAISNITLGGADAANYELDLAASQSTTTASITAKQLTVTSGVTVDDKTYDTTTSADVDFSGAQFSTVCTGDTVTLASATGTFDNKNVGTGKTVSLSNLTLGGADAGNYVLANEGHQTLTANITAKKVTVTGTITASNKTYDSTKAADIDSSSVSSDGIYPTDDATVSGFVGEFADKNVGTGIKVTLTKVELTGDDAGNYELDTTSTPETTANITQKEVTISGVTAKDKVYDGTDDAEIDTTGATIDTIYDGDNVQFKGVSGKFDNKNVGENKHVTFSGLTLDGTDAGNYRLSTTASFESTAKITAKPIKVTSGVVADNKVYDSTTTATINIAGAQFDSVISGDTVSLKSATGTFDNKNVGTNKAVTLSQFELEGSEAGNYTVASTGNQTPEADITVKEITVTGGVVAGNKTYDGTTNATVDVSGASFSSIYSGDEVLLSSATGTFENKIVGNAKKVSLSNFVLDGTDKNNYTVASTGNQDAEANITAKRLTIAGGLKASDKTYDSTTNVEVDVSGAILSTVCEGDTVNLASAAGTFDNKNVGTGKSVTLRDATLGGADAGNYVVATDGHQELTANITAKKVVVAGTLTASNKTYDSTTTAEVDVTNVSADGIYATDDAAVTGFVGEFADKNVGENIKVTLSKLELAGSDAGNYILDTTSAPKTTANITTKEVTISDVTAKDKVYDGTNVADIDTTGATINTIFDGDDVTFEGVSGQFENKNVGEDKTVTFSGLRLSGADAANYHLSTTASFDTSASITPKTITVNGGVTASNKIYDSNKDATVNVSGATFDAVCHGDTVALKSAKGTFVDKNVADGIAVTLSDFELEGTDKDNYVVADTGNQEPVANITKREITVSGGVTVSDKTYDGTTDADIDVSQAELSSVCSGDQVGLWSVKGTFESKNVGNSLKVTLSDFEIAGKDKLNYTLAASGHQELTANITAKELTVTGGVTVSDKTYDTTTNATVNCSGAQLSEVCEGETVTLTSADGTFDNKNVGTDKKVTLSNLTLGGANAGNYVVAAEGHQTPTANVTAKKVTVTGTFTASNKVYDSTRTAEIDVSNLTADGVYNSDNATVSGFDGEFDNKNVGTGKKVTLSKVELTGADAGNYTLDTTSTPETTANVTAKEVTISGVTAKDKVYDGTDSADIDTTDATVNTVYEGDDVQFKGVSGKFENKNVGENKKVTFSGLTLDGADATNYHLSTTASFESNAKITAKTIKVSGGVTAESRTYNAGTNATIDISGAQFDAVVGGDKVTLKSAKGTFDNKNVGTGKLVTLSDFELDGDDASNYVLAEEGHQIPTADITARRVNVTGALSTKEKVYDSTQVAEVDISKASFDSVVSGDDINLDSAVATFDNKNVGTNKTVILSGFVTSGKDKDNYDVASSFTVLTDGVITKKEISVTGGLTVANKVYDSTKTASVDVSRAKISSVCEGDKVTLKSVKGEFVDKNIELDKSVTLSNFVLEGDDAENYDVKASEDLSLMADITPKEVKIIGTINAKDKVYDATTDAEVATTSASVDTFFAGDDVSLKSVSGKFENKNVGTNKKVTLTGISLEGADAENYRLATIDALETTANITEKEVTISGVTAKDKVYDGTTAAEIDTTGATVDTIFEGDDVQFKGVSGEFSDKTVGTNKQVSFSGLELDGDDAVNYKLLSTAAIESTATISAKEIAITGGITAEDKTYDSKTDATVNLSGVTFDSSICGDDEVVLKNTKGAFADKNAGENKKVTINNLELDGADAGNYSLTTKSAETTASISKKRITVSGAMTTQQKTYDGSAAAQVDISRASLNPVSICAGDEIELSGAKAAFDTKDVGENKTVYVSSFEVTGKDKDNYDYSTGVRILSDGVITQKEIKVVGGLKVATKTYDGTTTATIDATDAQFDSLCEYDIVKVTSAKATFDNKNAGEGKSVTVTDFVLGGVEGDNYFINESANATGDITQKAVKVTGNLSAENKTYDSGTNASVTVSEASADGFIDGDTVSLNDTYEGQFVDKNVGENKKVTLTGAGFTGKDGGNYTLDTKDAITTQANITKKDVTITGLKAKDKVYDGTIAADIDATDAKINTIFDGDVVEFKGVNGGFEDKVVGTNKNVSFASLTLEGTDAGNYNLLSTESLSMTASISQREIKVSSGVTVQNKTYDQTTDATLNFSKAKFDAACSGDNVTLKTATGTFADEKAGNNKPVTLSNLEIEGADSGNYVLAAEGHQQPTANINKLEIRITEGLTVAEKTYNGDTHVASNLFDLSNVKLATVLEGDVVGLSSVEGDFEDEKPGKNKPLTLKNFVLAGEDADNYKIASSGNQSMTGTIGKAPYYINLPTFSGTNKTYDGNNQNTTFTFSKYDMEEPSWDDYYDDHWWDLYPDQYLTLHVEDITMSYASADAGKQYINFNVEFGGWDKDLYVGIVNNIAYGEIYPKTLSVSGNVKANPKIYDSTVNATLDASGLTVSGFINGDDAQFDGTAEGVFESKDVGINKKVKVTSLGITGKDAGNYALPDNLTLSSSGSISARSVTVSNATAKDKVYDGTKAAELDVDNAVIDTIYEGDDVEIQGNSGEFEDKNAGENKKVKFAGLSLSGNDAKNYILLTTSGFEGTANITKRPVTVSGITVKDKVYDATTKADWNASSASLSGVLPDDVASLKSVSNVEFTTKHAKGNSLANESSKQIKVTGTLEGTDAGNYFIDSCDTTAVIKQKEINLINLHPNSRAYQADPIKYDGVYKYSWISFDCSVGDIVGLIASDNIPSSLSTPDMYNPVFWAAYEVNDDGNAGDNKLFICTISGQTLSPDSENVTDVPEEVFVSARNYVFGEVTCRADILSVVKFETNCDTKIDDKVVHVNTKITDDVTSMLPTRAGYKFEGWYNNEECIEDSAAGKFKWNFSSNTITGNITTLYAKWTSTTKATTKTMAASKGTTTTDMLLDLTSTKSKANLATNLLLDVTPTASKSNAATDFLLGLSKKDVSETVTPSETTPEGVVSFVS